jgi:hypothetical protein
MRILRLLFRLRGLRSAGLQLLRDPLEGHIKRWYCEYSEEGRKQHTAEDGGADAAPGEFGGARGYDERILPKA